METIGKGGIMLDDKPAVAGFDGHVHFRAPSDLMPAVHAFARRKGLTSASWLRFVILDALERGVAYHCTEKMAQEGESDGSEDICRMEGVASSSHLIRGSFAFGRAGAVPYCQYDDGVEGLKPQNRRK